MKASEVLEQALKVINADGWHQGSFTKDKKSSNAPVCSLGALGRVLAIRIDGAVRQFDSEQENMFRLTAMLLEDQINFPTVHSWNDNRNTTIEDVNLVFKKAIYAAKENEL
jgi:hypothetical protein